MATATKRGGRRGGRRPGAWTHITPEKIREFREARNVSRARLAAVLGVSSTSVQNWETGNAVATTRLQSRLVDAIAQWSDPLAQRRVESAREGLAGRSGGGSGPVIEATGRIVASYVQHSKSPVDSGEIAKVIRDVRTALET